MDAETWTGDEAPATFDALLTGDTAPSTDAERSAACLCGALLPRGQTGRRRLSCSPRCKRKRDGLMRRLAWRRAAIRDWTDQRGTMPAADVDQQIAALVDDIRELTAQASRRTTMTDDAMPDTREAGFLKVSRILQTELFAVVNNREAMWVRVPYCVAHGVAEVLLDVLVALTQSKPADVAFGHRLIHDLEQAFIARTTGTRASGPLAH